jgi:hypothetical protein
MSAKLSVIFYIILCFEIGIFLTLLPWIPQGTIGLSDWGNNYFLVYATRKTGWYSLQAVVASGWVRGAVTGVGLLNIGIAFWEIFHFRQTVRSLQESTESREPVKADAVNPTQAAPLSHHERSNDRADNLVN